MDGKIQMQKEFTHLLHCKHKDISFHQDQSQWFKEHHMGFPSHKIPNLWVQMLLLANSMMQESTLLQSDNLTLTMSKVKETLKSSFKNQELTKVQKL